MIKKILFLLMLIALIVLSACSNDFDTDLSDCKRYYDGCNICQVENGKITTCTKMLCQENKEPKCLESI